MLTSCFENRCVLVFATAQVWYDPSRQLEYYNGCAIGTLPDVGAVGLGDVIHQSRLAESPTSTLCRWSLVENLARSVVLLLRAPFF